MVELSSKSDNFSNPPVKGPADLTSGITEELAGVSEGSFACSLRADVSRLKFLNSGDQLWIPLVCLGRSLQGLIES